MRAIDTNVLVRALVNDNAAQSARAVALLTGHDIFIPVTVVPELERVLRSRYAFTPKVVAQAIEKMAAMGNVVVGERAAVMIAAARAAQGWDFADALHHAFRHGCEDFLTLDVDSVKRGVRVTTSGAKVLPVIATL